MRKICHSLLNSIQKFIQTPMGQGIFLIAKSNIIGQGILLISSPVLTRLFSPSDFGTFSIYSSILSILLVFSSLKYEYAIPLPKKENEAFNLTILSITLVLFFGLCLLGIIIFFEDIILKYYSFSFVNSFSLFILVSYFFSGCYQVLNFWAIREKNYSLIGNVIIRKNISATSGKMVFGLFSLGPYGLIIGDLIGHITGTFSVLNIFWRKNSFFLNQISYNSIVSMAKKYYRFPFFSLPSAFFNVLAFQLPILLLTSMYGISEVGFYSLAASVLAVPASFLSSSVSQVYLGEISIIISSEPKKIRPIYHGVIKKISIVTIPVVILIAILAPTLFPILFGNSWAIAGLYCSFISIMVIFQVILSPVSILHYAGFNNWVLLFDITRTLIILSIFGFGYCLHISAAILIFLYSLAMAVMYFFNYLMNIKAMSILEKKCNNIKE